MMISRAELFALTTRAARGAGVPLSQCYEFAALLSSIEQDLLNDLSADICAALEGDRHAPEGQNGAGGWTVEKGDVLQSIPAVLDLQDAGHKVTYPSSDLLSAWSAFRASGFVRATGPIEPDVALKSCLDRLAWNTYVPSTEESRSGAGAGDIDND